MLERAGVAKRGALKHVKPMDNSQDAAANADSQPPSRATASLVAAIAPSLPTGPVRSESGVRAVQRAGVSESVPVEDADTAVDASPSSQPLTNEERLFLSEQIQAALEKTLTPMPPASGVVQAKLPEHVPQRPPPRKSSAAPPGTAHLEAPDHVPFALARPISAPEPEVAQRPSGIMLPPPPQPGDMEPDLSLVPSAGARPSDVVSSGVAPSSVAPSFVSVRAPSQMSAPAPRATQPKPAPVPEWRPPSLSDMPSVDPFAGFVRPPPSALQRLGMALLIALAVFGLCALAAIGFGYLGLGKIGW